ncbi:MAG: DUF3667 domain-containing protein [Anaeromyxobacteraceae bacterium]
MEPAQPPAPGAPAPAGCPNCGGPAPARFCPACGQEQRALRVPFRRVVADALDEALSLDSRLAHTLPALFLRPGAASLAWREGRRASHTSPTKLYLLASFVFFLAVAAGPNFGVQAGTKGVRLGPSEPRSQEMSLGGAATVTSPVEASDAELADMRARGLLGRTFAEHVERLKKLPPEDAQRRLNAVFVDNTARAMFVILPLAALLLLLLHPRRGLFYTDHLVFAAHAQTVTFVLLTPGLLFASGGLSFAGGAAACGHLLLAMRRHYGTGWAGTALRWLLLSFGYLLLLTVAVAGAAVVAILTS